MWSALLNQAQASQRPEPGSLEELQMQLAQSQQPVFTGTPTPAMGMATPASMPELPPEVKADVSAKVQSITPQNAPEMSQNPVTQDERMRSLMDQYSLTSEDALRQQQQGITNAEANLNELRLDPARLDLSPLMAYTDSVAGTNLAQSYRRPQNQRDQKLEIMGLQERLQGQKGQYSQQALQSLRDQMDMHARAQQAPLDRALLEARIGKEAQGGGNPLDQRLKELRIQEMENKAQKEKDAIEAGNKTVARAGQTLIRDSATLLNKLQSNRGFGVGKSAWMGYLPGTTARDIRGDIESIKGNIGVDQLMKMKKSNVGLGNVTEKQLFSLQSLLGSLDPSLTRDKLEANVRDIMTLYAEIVEDAGGDPFEMAMERGYDPETGRINPALIGQNSRRKADLSPVIQQYGNEEAARKRMEELRAKQGAR